MGTLNIEEFCSVLFTKKDQRLNKTVKSVLLVNLLVNGLDTELEEAQWLG